ncbi:hypothetical protein ACPCAA_17850 [Streptomyces griseoincarnatus]
MSTSMPDLIKLAAGTVDRHKGVVCLALQADSESLRLSAQRARARAHHAIANERDEESGLAGHVGNALTYAGNTSFWVEHHWSTILAAVVRREAEELAHRRSLLEWLATYEGETDAPVFQVQAWQYKHAGKRAAALADVKAALTAVRDAAGIASA